jgi:uncharacterized protein YbjT (DUF2867 family)
MAVLGIRALRQRRYDGPSPDSQEHWPLFSSAPVRPDEVCAPVAEHPLVCIVAGPEAQPAAQRAADILTADGHSITVTSTDSLAPLAGAAGVLVLGGLDLEAAARACAPASAYVRGELLEGPAPAWDAMVLRAARGIAIAAEPQAIGMCG